MNRFAALVTRFPAAILVLSLILAGISVIGVLKTPINYDIFSYMPKEVESMKGQLIMAEEFKAADTAFVMMKFTNTPDVLKIKMELSVIKGVERVVWISDLVDPSVPDIFIPSELLSLFKKGEHLLLHISFSSSGTSDVTQNAIREIKTRIKEGEAFTGLPVFLYELKELVQQQKMKSILTAVILSGCVTAIATRSLAIPALFLIAMGMGILYNMGTNYFMGSISYLTEALSAVIQLGVTIDFSIFLMHRYREETSGTTDKRQAMINALMRTAHAIIPCALVTMTGFLALAFMRIRIGYDMGMVMAKGVFFGLLGTMIILPALTLIFERFMPIREVKHSDTLLTRMARRLVAWPISLTLILVLLFIPSLYIREHANLSYSLQDILPQNLRSLQAIHEIEKAMGSIELVNILLPKETPRWTQKQTIDAIGRLPGVVQTISLESIVDPAIPDAFIPTLLKEQFTRGAFTLAVVRINLLPGSNEANEMVEKIRKTLKEQKITGAYVSGATPISKDLTDLSATDLARVDLVALIGICLIITVVFLSISIPVVLVAGILLAIFINLSIPYLFGHSIPYITFSCITSIQLGTCVNYAIFLMSRYREERKSHQPKIAMVNSLVGTAPAILTSGMCLFSATVGLVFISDVSMVQSLALMIARGALLAAAIIILLLPGLVLIADKVICATSFGWKKSMVKES